MVLVLGAFGAGWLGGRQSHAIANHGGELTSSPSSAVPGKTARDSSRRQWGMKLGERSQEDIAAMAREIPRKDLGPSIEAWFDSYGIGGLDSETVRKAWSLIDAWVAEDFDSAWAWANSIQQPASREFVIKAIAGSLAESDSAKAFECLVSNGAFISSFNDDRLVNLITGLSKESLAQGPEKFVEFWKKIPSATERVNAFVGVTVDPPPGTDFQALQGAIDRELGKEMERPINPSGVMAAWTKADRGAAVDYVFARAAAGQEIRDQWGEVRNTLVKEYGSAAASEWTMGLLRELPEGERGRFFLAAQYQNMPGAFFDLLRSGGGSEEETATYLRETLQAGVDEGRPWGISTLLSSLPVEERIRHAKELHGQKAFEAVKANSASWNLTESQLEEIRSAIKAE